MKLPGQRLRRVRQSLGLSLSDVEAASRLIAQREGDRSFIISKCRLSQIEQSGSAPGPTKILALAEIYGAQPAEILLLWKGAIRSR